jgi:BirA family biotin operon repressor/biotin-[acetyl-CoA-carboxylase] ligase
VRHRRQLERSSVKELIDWRLEKFTEIESTSTHCVARAKAAEPAGLAVLAEWQSAGRGSRGRDWESAAGNLFLSVLLRPNLPVSALGVYPLLAGLALADAVRTLAPKAKPPMLKWPNDVLIDNAKLAGVLIDAGPEDGRIAWLVIGLGLNLAAKPAIAERRTACLADFGVTVAPVDAAYAVLAALSIRLDDFATFGAEALQDAWLDQAHPVGTWLNVRGADGETGGRFAGLSPAGELLLRVESRIEKFQTGEILLGH